MRLILFVALTILSLNLIEARQSVLQAAQAAVSTSLLSSTAVRVTKGKESSVHGVQMVDNVDITYDQAKQSQYESIGVKLSKSQKQDIQQCLHLNNEQMTVLQKGLAAKNQNVLFGFLQNVHDAAKVHQNAAFLESSNDNNEIEPIMEQWKDPVFDSHRFKQVPKIEGAVKKAPKPFQIPKHRLAKLKAVTIVNEKGEPIRQE